MSESKRGIVSALLFAHCFCVALAWSANWSRSPLQDRVLNAAGVRTYLRLLNFDTPFVVDFPVTHAQEYQDDHRLIVESPEGTVVAEYPPSLDAWRGGFRSERMRRFFGRFAALVQENEGEAISELFRTIAQEAIATNPQLTVNAQRPMVIRFLRLHPPELDAPRDAVAEPMEAFIADVWRDESGTMRVNKRVAVGDAAQVKQ